jgi:ABC-type transport system involved in multi-copper enzyme maturation permease subunit
MAGVVAAQIETELRIRLRSPATLVAALAAFAGTLLWIPDPRGRVTSLSWISPAGRVVAPAYSSAYVGYAVTTVVTVLATWFGFYLIAGGVRRDGERGVGAILAATPLSRWQYLLGKFAAHAAYLLLVAAMALGAGLVAFARFGVGPFSARAFFVLPLAIAAPALAVTASLALLFDVTPGLRGRAGLVAWFFVFIIVLIAVPTGAAGASGGIPGRRPVVDPAGLATQTWLVRQTIPLATSLATGLIVHDQPVERVPWQGISLSGGLVALRAANLLFALAPLALATLIFNRFDPARAPRRWREGRRRGAPPPAEPLPAGQGRPSELQSLGSIGTLHPSSIAAVAAEARMTWSSAGWMRWPLAASALGAAALPSPAATASAAAFFLLLVPVISECASREEIAGTRGLVFSQPAVPSSALAWKAASLALFVLALCFPAIVRAAAAAPLRGIELALGALFTAAFAAGCSWLTGGGKLFSALYLVLWYAAINRIPRADFAGVFSASPRLAVSGAYLGVAIAVLVTARLLEGSRQN